MVRPLSEQRLQANAAKVVKDCCGVREGEIVVVLTNPDASAPVAAALTRAVADAGAEPILVQTEPLPLPGADLPKVLDDVLAAADLILAPTSKSVYHTRSVREACRDAGTRFVALSEADVDTFVSGGMNANFVALTEAATRVSELLDQARSIHLETPAGTALSSNVGPRRGLMSGGTCREPGDVIGLPTVEAFIAPLEATVQGTVVVDASCSGGVGVVDHPIVIEVADGRANEIAGGDAANRLRDVLAENGEDSVYQVAEIGIGLNPMCRITGRIIEDEGTYGTCHVALGSNVWFGGDNPAPSHIDLVQWRPTITLDDEPLCRDGELVSEELRRLVAAGSEADREAQAAGFARDVTS
jgi:leucyl aminopeptidase (aminopeptidase T)